MIKSSRTALILMASLVMHMSAKASENPALGLGVIDESFYEVVGNVVAQYSSGIHMVA